MHRAKEPRLKIALVILRADPQRGGAERYTWDLARALRARGHDVTLVASEFPVGGPVAGELLLPARAATRVGRYVRFLDALEQHLSKERYDVVHAMLPVRRCDVYHPHAGIAAETVAAGHLKHGGRVEQAVALAAGRLNRRRQKLAQIEQCLLRCSRAPVVLCLSGYVKRFVRKHYDLPEQKLATLFNAVDLRAFDPTARPSAGQEVRARFGIAPDRIVALMLAQDYQRKGLREAILATARVPDRRLVLLVGGKQDPFSYRQLAAAEGISDRVIFAGPTSDPYALYGAADFFVLPTRHDPCSLVVLEAMAMGLPVISTVFNGACEIMNDGLHGFVLKDPKHVGALSGAMEKILDPQLRASMARASLDLRPQLSYEKHLDRLLDIYERTRP